MPSAEPRNGYARQTMATDNSIVAVKTLKCETPDPLPYKLLIVHIISMLPSFSAACRFLLSLFLHSVFHCTYFLIVAGRLLSLSALHTHYLHCILCSCNYSLINHLLLLILFLLVVQHSRYICVNTPSASISSILSNLPFVHQVFKVRNYVLASYHGPHGRRRSTPHQHSRLCSHRLLHQGHLLRQFRRLHRPGPYFRICEVRRIQHRHHHRSDRLRHQQRQLQLHRRRFHLQEPHRQR